MSVWNSVYSDRTGLPFIDVSKIDKETIDKINEAFMKDLQPASIRLDEGYLDISFDEGAMGEGAGEVIGGGSGNISNEEDWGFR